MFRGTDYLEFVYLTSFDKGSDALVDAEDLRWLEWVLLQKPRLGVVVPGCGGARKLRIPSHGRGKRGGRRVIYLYVEVRGRIYFLLAYDKGEQQGLSPRQRAAVQKLVDLLKTEV